jgi:hypothetical protein
MYGPLQNGGSAYNPNPFNWNHAAHPNKPRPAAETKSSARGPRGHASPRASRRIGCGPNRAVSHTAHCPSRPGGAGDGRWHRILRHTGQDGSAGPHRSRAYRHVTAVRFQASPLFLPGPGVAHSFQQQRANPHRPVALPVTAVRIGSSSSVGLGMAV